MGATNQRVTYNVDTLARTRHDGVTAPMAISHSKQKIAKKQNERILRKKFERKERTLSRFTALMIVFVLGLLCVGQYSLVQDMGLKINEQKVALQSLNAENEALRQKSAALSNKSVIEEKAKKELGMQASEETIVYTPTAVKK